MDALQQYVGGQVIILVKNPMTHGKLCAHVMGLSVSEGRLHLLCGQAAIGRLDGVRSGPWLYCPEMSFRAHGFDLDDFEAGPFGSETDPTRKALALRKPYWIDDGFTMIFFPPTSVPVDFRKCRIRD